MNIFIDLDGVLCDFVGGVCRYLGKSNPYGEEIDCVGGESPVFDGRTQREINKNPGRYDLHNLLGVSESEMWDAINERDFWASLDAYPWAHDFVSYCERFGAVYFATAPSLHWSSPAGKHLWIEKHFPRFLRRYVIGAPKFLLANTNAVLIDDNEKNCREFRKEGRECFLFPRPWNEKWEDVDNNPIGHIDSFLQRTRALYDFRKKLLSELLRT